jgi:hypothetical protein
MTWCLVYKDWATLSLPYYNISEVSQETGEMKRTDDVNSYPNNQSSSTNHRYVYGSLMGIEGSRGDIFNPSVVMLLVDHAVLRKKSVQLKCTLR